MNDNSRRIQYEAPFDDFLVNFITTVTYSFTIFNDLHLFGVMVVRFGGFLHLLAFRKIGAQCNIFPLLQPVERPFAGGFDDFVSVTS
jgi:hypothetical protein